MTQIIHPPSVVFDALEQLIASSPVLQGAVGKPPEKVRDEHVFNDYAWYALSEDGMLRAMRPLVVIQDAEESLTRDTMSGGTGQGNVWSFSFHVLITDNAKFPGSNDAREHRESKRKFKNFTGGILSDLDRYAGNSGNLGFATIETLFEATRTPPQYRTKSHDIWEVAYVYSSEEAL